jgi:hypothetical protein
MSSIQEINNLIAEYQDKIKQLEKEKIKINFINYFEISETDIKKMKNLEVEANYEYHDHVMDEYGHSVEATLKVNFNDKEYFNIIYTEEQGKGTESRYSPTTYCNITGTKLAKKILLEKIDIGIDDDDEYEWRDLIEKIVTE